MKRQTRILLVNLAGGAEPVKGLKMPPYSLQFVSSYARKSGLDSRVLDLATSDNWAGEFTAYLQSDEFTIIGFTSSTENRFNVRDAIGIAKVCQPSAVIVVGGDTFTYTAEQALSQIPEIDFVVRGEGEVTFLNLANCLIRGGATRDIKGISYRQNGTVLHNAPREPEPDIDQFSITDDVLSGVLLPRGKYSPFVYLRNYDNRIKALPVTIGRGCPNQCVFCLNPMRKYRYRSIESVIGEIRVKQSRFNCNAFYMEDPHLVKKPDYVRELCDAILRGNLNIAWWAETRMDIGPDILEMMRRAGCVSLDFGLESASSRVLAAIKKGIEPGQAEVLLGECHRLGIRVGVFAMVSLPDEDENDARMTLDFMRRNIEHIHSPIYTITKIFPGAELEAIAKKRGNLPPSFNWYDREYSNELPDLVTPVVPLYREKLSPEFIRRCWGEAQWIAASKRSLSSTMNLYALGIPRLLLDWKTQGIGDKVYAVGRALSTLIKKFDIGKKGRK